jgi:hypothetical protein
LSKSVFLRQRFLKSIDFDGHVTPKDLGKFLDIGFRIRNGLFEVFFGDRIFYRRSSHLQLSKGNGYITELLSIYVILPIFHVSNIYSHNKPLSLLLLPC